MLIIYLPSERPPEVTQTHRLGAQNSKNQSDVSFCEQYEVGSDIPTACALV